MSKANELQKMGPEIECLTEKILINPALGNVPEINYACTTVHGTKRELGQIFRRTKENLIDLSPELEFYDETYYLSTGKRNETTCKGKIPQALNGVSRVSLSLLLMTDHIEKTSTKDIKELPDKSFDNPLVIGMKGSFFEAVSSYLDTFCPLTEYIEDERKRWESLFRLVWEKPEISPYNRFDTYIDGLSLMPNGFFGACLKHFILKNGLNPEAKEGYLISNEFYTLMEAYRKNNSSRFNGGCPVKKSWGDKKDYSVLTKLGQIIVDGAYRVYEGMTQEDLDLIDFRC